ncbi:MAG: HlyC/CorC family transporter [Acidobacteriales bacterium]|nr:HlyC/CorC family transporter [Terriglobales bacterium]
MVASVLLQVFLVLLLIAANAFFAAAEFSLVSVRDTRIQQLIESRRIGAGIVQKLHRNLDEVVNGVQLGITIVSLTLGWIGEPIVARIVEGLRFVREVPHAAVYAHGVAIVLAFTLITCLHVILGELVPKSLALQRAEQLALAVAAPMDIFLTLTRPVLFLMSRAAGGVLRIFGSPKVRHGPIHSPDELKLIVTASRQLGQIPGFQEEMIHRALELEEITVREVMVPRPDIFSLPGDLTLDEALARVVEEQHSRIPVYDPKSGPEHIIGVLYSKDLMRWTRLRLIGNPAQVAAARLASMKISQIMHDVLVVPETKALTELLNEFKLRKRHLAVVVDEFGSTAGVVTVEDILEQLVGEIEDEFDAAPAEPPAIDGRVNGKIDVVLDGSAGIRDLESQYQILLPRGGAFETLAGFALSQLQKIPVTGDHFDYSGYRFTVEEMEGRRIARVRIEQRETPHVEQQV